MADKTTKELELVVSAKDNATPTLAKAEERLKRLGLASDEMEQKGARGPQRSSFEQAVRDEQAGILRAMRSAGQRGQIRDAARSALGLDEKPQKNEFDLTDELPQLPALTAKDFGRSRRTAGQGMEESKGFFKSLKEQSEGIEGIAKIAKGLAALSIARETGEMLQRLPEGIKRYEEALKDQDKSQNNTVRQVKATAVALAEGVPVIGELAKGFRTLWDEVGGKGASDRAKDKFEEERDAQRQARDEIVAKRDAKRNEIMTASEQGARSANEDLRLNGLTGDDRARMEAQVALEREMRQIGEEAGKRGSLSPEQQKKFDEQTTQRRFTAQQKYFTALDKIQNDAMQKAFEADRDSEDRRSEQDAAAKQEQLQREGRFRDAKVAAIQKGADDEIEVARKRMEQETQGENAGSELAKRAQDRYQAERIAIQAKADEQIKRLKSDNANEDADRERGHREELKGVYAQAIVDRLQLQGRAADAEKVQLAEQHRERLASIKNNLEEQVRQHKEMEPELRRQAAEDVTAENARFAGQGALLMQKLHAPFLADRNRGITGESRTLTGITAGKANDPMAKVAKATEDSLALTKESRDLLKTLVDLWRQSPPVKRV